MRYLLSILSLLFLIPSAKSQCDTVYLKNAFVHDTSLYACPGQGLVRFARVSLNDVDLDLNDRLVWAVYTYSSPTDSTPIYFDTATSFANSYSEILINHVGETLRGFAWKDSSCKYIPDTASWLVKVDNVAQLKTESCSNPFQTKIIGETLVDAQDTTAKTYVLDSPEITTYLNQPGVPGVLYEKQIRNANGGSWEYLEMNSETSVTLDSIPYDTTILRYSIIEVECSCISKDYQSVPFKDITIYKDYSGGTVSTLYGDVRVSRDDSCGVTFPSGKIMLKSEGDFGNKFFFTDENGVFKETFLGVGNGVVTIADPKLRDLSCNQSRKDVPFSFSVNDTSETVDLRLKVGPGKIIISSQGWARKQRPTNGFYQIVTLRNEGAPITGNLIWSTPNTGSNGYRQIHNTNSKTANSNSDSQVLWSNVSLGFEESRTFTVKADVLGTAIMGENIGTSVNFFAGQETFSEDFNVLIRNSYDPNDKRVSHKGITPAVLQAQTPLMTYHIRFQNTGNDTAFNILVTDTLSDKLNFETFHLGSSSHPYEFTVDGNVLKWQFNNIMLPDSGTDYDASNGHVFFYIEPVKTLQLGDFISNKANIFFDQNPPIITNAAITNISNTVGINEFAELEIGLYPNPAKSKIYLETKEQITEASIFSVDGRKLETTGITGKTINISTLKKGHYLLMLKTQPGMYTIKKFVKE